ncbi:MAG: protein translocase subunit SecF, partial [Candidatus Magasanikbacteria bacterium]|nr:protein translocase subunit SecF [Candidatus Magasanikbacteria bacterium]
TNQVLEEKLIPLVEKPVIIPTGDKGAIIKMKLIDEAKHQQVFSALKELSGSAEVDSVKEKRFEMIGPTVSSDLRTKSFLAIVFVLLAIVAYIALAFRKVSRPVSSWKFGVAAVLALLHDVIIPVGVFSALGHFMGIEVDTLFVTALLTVLGFSVHDTIVVFDRIRENLLKFPRENFDEIVNRSINQTFVRSINTSLTVLLVLLATFFFGGESVRYFVLALIVGVFFGTYSSIFIASPILVIWNRFSSKKGV